MDQVALEGYAAVLSGLIVFCGSVWLLLAVVMGSRLAYFVTASVVLSFLLIMSIVWSTSQLGPLGDLPKWNHLDAAAEPSEIDFGPATAYPGGDWYEADPEDDAELSHLSEAEGAATELVDTRIEEGKIDTFADADEKEVTTDSTRLIEVGGDLYGATLFQEASPEGQDQEPASVGDPNTVLAVVALDPGNPLGLARQIMVGTLLLLILHLFGLSRAERKAKISREFA